MTPIFPANQRICASSSKNVAILPLWSKRAIVAPMQQFDRQSALQTSQKYKNDRIPFTLTFHPHNHAVKSIILNNFKLLQNDPETGRIFSQPPLISFKRDKNVGNFLVRSALKTKEQPRTFKCARHDAKLVFSLLTLARYRDLSNLLRSPIVSHVPPQMSFIA